MKQGMKSILVAALLCCLFPEEAMLLSILIIMSCLGWL